MARTIKAAQRTQQAFSSPTELSTYVPSGYTVAGLVSFAFTVEDDPTTALPVTVVSITQSDPDDDGAVLVSVGFVPTDPTVNVFSSGKMTLLIDTSSED